MCCPYQKPHPARKSLKLAGTTANFRWHECPLVVSLNAAVGFTVTSKHAYRDSCFTASACCASAADEQAAEPENRRPFAVGDALAGLVAVAVSAGNRQTGNRNRLAVKGCRWYWRWKSRAGKSGRPCVSREIRELIRQMSTANPLWGAPRIHGELLKLGIHVSQATVAKYMVRERKPPSQTWRTFLENHVKQQTKVHRRHHQEIC